MNTETVPIAALHPPARNVRTHPEYQIAEFARAIEMFGQTRPIVIDEDNTVLAGNGLVLACERLGRREITALRITGLSRAAKDKLMLSDNRIFELGTNDNNAILEAIRGLDGDFDIPGFDPENLAFGLVDFETALQPEPHRRRRRNDPPPPGQSTAAELRCPHCGHRFTE